MLYYTFSMKKRYLLLILMHLCLTTIFAQTRVDGIVFDADDDSPIIGGNVIVQGTSVGTITDFDGKFSITMPSDHNTIIISYLGY